MKIEKGVNYVVRCIRDNNNRFGFGYRHKKGQFVTYIGKGSFDINEAHIYKHNKNGDMVFDETTDLWEKYYEYVPLIILTKLSLTN
ncbi:MAG: hypothetical protein WC119_00405 [Synergistaceae bacterium]